MKELVEYIAKSLVDFPDQVKVVETGSHSGLVLELSVADSDVGRVIGRGGRVVNAMRSLVRVMAEKDNRRVSLEIV